MYKSNPYLPLALAIVFATMVAAWMFRYEDWDKQGVIHRNRFTGVLCPNTEECWFASTFKF